MPPIVLLTDTQIQVLTEQLYDLKSESTILNKLIESGG